MLQPFIRASTMVLAPGLAGCGGDSATQPAAAARSSAGGAGYDEAVATAGAIQAQIAVTSAKQTDCVGAGSEDKFSAFDQILVSLGDCPDGMKPGDLRVDRHSFEDAVALAQKSTPCNPGSICALQPNTPT